MSTAPDTTALEYDVDDAFELSMLPELVTGSESPSLPSSAGSERFTTEATYFDTADHRLLQAGVGVRRQTGSPDEGWHLQVELEAGALHEMKAALGRSERTVPIQFRRLLWVQTRDEPLVPVGTVTTEREVRRFGLDGQHRVEITHDRVALRDEPVSWQRVRVGFLDGDPKLRKQVDRQLRRLGAERSTTSSVVDEGLGRHLGGERKPSKAAGKRRGKKLSPTSTSGDVIVAYLARELDRITSEDISVRLDRPDSIHQMRVATRRLRGAFRTFEPLFDADAVRPLEGELKWLAGELGRARDAEVMRERLLDAVSLEQAQRHSTGGVTRSIDRETKRSQREAFADVVAALGSERYHRLVETLEEVVSQPPFTERAGRPARKELRRRVAEAAGKVRKSLDTAAALPDGDGRNDQLHKTRKAAKRARYAAEAVTPALGKDAEAFGLAMERLQDTLGEYHDSVVTQERLHDLALQGTAATAFALGRLHAQQSRQQEALESAIGKVATGAEKKSLRAWLT